MQESHRRQGKRGKGGRRSSEVVEDLVNRNAGLGRIAKGIQAMVSPGVAADTPQVQKKLVGSNCHRSRSSSSSL